MGGIPDQPRILLVEDDVLTAYPLMTVLNKLGYEVRQTSTLAGAFDKLHEWTPAGLLLDLTLPDGNGIDVLRHIREHQLRISVAVITGEDDQQRLDDVRKLQPDAIFSKPIHLPELMDWLHAAMRRKKS